MINVKGDENNEDKGKKQKNRKEQMGAQPIVKL